MHRWIAVGLALVLAAGCGDRNAGVDFGDQELGPDRHSVLSEDGFLRMALTDRFVYFALSDSARAAARAELDADAESGGIRGLLGGFMRGVVGKALDFRATYPVSEIRDIRWEDDRLRFVFTDPDRRLDDNLHVGEEGSVNDAFSEASVRAFAEAFRAVKAAAVSDAAGGGPDRD